jgi:hypothetical protein
MTEGTTFHGPIEAQNALAGVNLSDQANLTVNINRADNNSRPSPATPAKPCRVIPFPPNQDIIDRPDIFARLDQLLPEIPEYRAAALWGLGGSG